jgi:hypothetical protein
MEDGYGLRILRGMLVWELSEVYLQFDGRLSGVSI